MEPFELKQFAEGCNVLKLSGWEERYPLLTAGISSRHGGVSEVPYAGLNCGLHVGDAPDNVVRNRALLAEAAGNPFDSCTYAEQVHGKEVQVVTASLRGAGRLTREDALPSKDGFVTNVPGIVLHALFADCVPLYFYDPVKKAAGLAHAGWKGTVLQIGQTMVETMSAAYGTKPRDIIAAIGPSIGACCYEVDETVTAPVHKLLDRLGVSETITGQSIINYKSDGKAMLSLQQLNRQIMIKAGILPSHIEISNLCTSCRTDLFFSHRQEEGQTGRMAAWIGLREEVSEP